MLPNNPQYYDFELILKVSKLKFRQKPFNCIDKHVIVITGYHMARPLNLDKLGVGHGL